MSKTDEPAVDAQWITKAEALKELKKSERTLDRLVTAGRIQKQMQQRANRPPEPLFYRADVKRLTAVNGFLLEPENAGKQVSRPALPFSTESLGALAQLFAAVLQMQSTAPAVSPKAPMARWLPVKEAAAYLGLSVRMVRTLITGGFLPALRDGRILKVRREDLDALEVPREFREEPVRATRASDQTMARSNNGSGHAA